MSLPLYVNCTVSSSWTTILLIPGPVISFGRITRKPEDILGHHRHCNISLFWFTLLLLIKREQQKQQHLSKSNQFPTSPSLLRVLANSLSTIHQQI